VITDDAGALGLTFVGRETPVWRTLDSVYLDQAEHHFDEYVRAVLLGSVAAGGRYNPRGEFGALYTASDEDTAWEEVAARFRRQGVERLPPDMGVIALVLSAGRYADLTDAATRERWEVSEETLSAGDPTAGQAEQCHALARAVHAVGDFLAAPSARAGGSNLPLYPDRPDGQLAMSLAFALSKAPPDHLLQRTGDPW
jgi:RES domain-containing protein